MGLRYSWKKNPFVLAVKTCMYTLLFRSEIWHKQHLPQSEVKRQTKQTRIQQSTFTLIKKKSWVLGANFTVVCIIANAVLSFFKNSLSLLKENLQSLGPHSGCNNTHKIPSSCFYLHELVSFNRKVKRKGFNNKSLL